MARIDPYEFWVQKGKLELGSQIYLQGNYTVHACNYLGCIQRDCSVYWAGPPPTKRQPKTAQSDSKWLWFGAAVLVLLLIAAVVLYVFMRWRKQKASKSQTSGFAPGSEMVPLNMQSDNATYCSPGLLSFPPDVPLFATNCLRIISELGEGAFGKVYLAECKDWTVADAEAPGFEKGIKQVAAKKLKIFSRERMSSLRIEASNLALLKHPNIVCFYGACLTSEDDIR